MSIAGCRLIDLPVVEERRGNLTYVESGRHVPFELKRVYYLYDVPGGAERGGHAHRALHQLIIAMSGAFDVHVTDGTERRTFRLSRSYQGLYLPPMIWREIDNFSGGSVCMVLASEYYDEDDYFRNFDNFLAVAGG
jgi:dTDP-4-dehydrorhamnose 3,5-epimerase-like enzyme